MIYNIVIYFVLWGIAIASLFNEKVRKMWRGEREAFKILKQKVDPNAKYIWFHAASLGEFEQGRPLMEQIRKDYPQYKILLTFSQLLETLAYEVGMVAVGLYADHSAASTGYQFQ